jgi:DNA-binding GntR family transcriptional regulator
MAQVNFLEIASAALQNQKSASVVIADTLRLAIVRGQFEAGQPMPQEELAKHFGVSRAPVRDALRQLESEGLIVMHPHRGAEVARLTAEGLEEVFYIREALESQAIRLAIPKMTAADYARADSVLQQIDEDADPAHMAELNWAFHESIYQAAGLPRLLNMIRNLFHNALPHHDWGTVGVDLKKVSQLGHRAILKACREHTVEAAVAALSAHLWDNAPILKALLPSEEQEAPPTRNRLVSVEPTSEPSEKLAAAPALKRYRNE